MIVLPCWIFVADAKKYSKDKDKDSKAAPSHKLYVWSTFLSENYLYTYRRFDERNLVVTDIERYVGNILSLTKVIGIIDLDEGPLPIFLKESAIESIRSMLNETKSSAVV